VVDTVAGQLPIILSANKKHDCRHHQRLKSRMDVMLATDTVEVMFQRLGYFLFFHHAKQRQSLSRKLFSGILLPPATTVLFYF
jgi:hypothetical protein